MTDVQILEQVMAGLFKDRRPLPHPWLRVIGTGRHGATGEPYVLIMLGGSGASWWLESEIDLFPDEPPP